MNNYFDKASKILWMELQNGKNMALATSADDKVTVRTVSGVSYNESIYIVTEKQSKKCAQIMLNDNVALCTDTIKITGIARLLGHPLDEKNKLPADALKTGFGDWFNQYATSPNAVLIEIIPNSAELAIMGEGAPEVYNIDYITQTATKM